MQWERYNFSDDFQNAIIACLLDHPEEFTAFGEIIEPKFFRSPVAIEVVYWLKDYVKKYAGIRPSFDTLGNYVFHNAKRRMGERAKELVEYVQRLSEIDTRDWQAVRDLSIAFAKERALLSAMTKVLTAQKEGKADTVDPVKEIQAALDVGQNYSDLGVHLYHDLEYVVNKVSNIDYGVHTGYPLLDGVWKSGWPKGTLVCLLAPPKRYKTTFAINLALNMASQKMHGGDVLYYACEINQELAMLRAIYNLSGQNEEDLFDQGINKFIKIAKTAVARQVQHHVWFKGFPSKTATINDIKNNARYVIQRFGIKPKAIFIDYAETVRPDSVDKKAPDWRQQADIYTQARAMGAELGCCIIMPDRCNKDAVDRKVPSMSSFQGSFEKAGVVDAAIGLCATEAEHKQNRIRYFIFLNRNGEQYLHFGGTVDPKTYRMTLTEKLEYDPEAEEEELEAKRHGRRRKKDAPRVDDDVEKTQAAYGT